MVRLLLMLLANGAFLLVGDWLLSGVSVDSYKTAVIAAIVIGLVNFFIKPLVSILALPLTLITLGLFQFIINAGMLLAASEWVDGFWIKNIWWGLGLSLVLGFLNSLFGLDKKADRRRHE